MIDTELLRILVCPLSRAPLVEDSNRLVSTDPQTRRAYPVDDGIPVMLIEEASTLTPEEHAQVLARTGAQPWSPPTKESQS